MANFLLVSHGEYAGGNAGAQAAADAGVVHMGFHRKLLLP